MGRKKLRGYVFVSFKGDHRPYHVHIYRGKREIGRWDIENQRPMDSFEMDSNLRSAFTELRYMSGEGEDDDR